MELTVHLYLYWGVLNKSERNCVYETNTELYKADCVCVCYRYLIVCLAWALRLYGPIILLICFQVLADSKKKFFQELNCNLWIRDQEELSHLSLVIGVERNRSLESEQISSIAVSCLLSLQCNACFFVSIGVNLWSCTLT